MGASRPVTLGLDPSVLERVKVRAAERGTSVSAIIREFIEDSLDELDDADLQLKK
jgi:predicted DNA-binding protein